MTRPEWSESMRAMVLNGPRQRLIETDLPIPSPVDREVLLRVRACGVCRTDLHIVDGELDDPVLPIVPGHQIVATVEGVGENAHRFALGDRVGVPWLGHTDGICRFCLSGRENLCDHAEFTGYHRNGGYAEWSVADERFCFPIPDNYSDVQAAPLLCAGLIGFRALGMTENARRIGFYGFGSAAHILTQVARHQGREIFAFTRAGDTAGQDFARGLGAVWAGGSDEQAPVPLDAAIIFAPAGPLVPAALRALDKGGRVVCAGIHMSDIPAFPYELLWEERSIQSVANLTRDDGERFLALAGEVTIDTVTTIYPLANANQALDDLRSGKIEGAAVLDVSAGSSS
jgi:propanol-preferring alcohol dehydrogenase